MDAACNHHNSNYSCLSAVPIFQGLTPQEQAEVANITLAKTYKRGEHIYHAGDAGGALYVLHQGQVKLYRLSVSGREQVLRVLGPGEFFGELSLFSNQIHADSAQALGEGTMCVLEGEPMKELMTRLPIIALKVMDSLSRRLEKADSLLEAVNLSSVGQRLATAILDFSQGKQAFSLPMSKGDLASQLGMSQETLSRKLTAMAEEGLLELEGQRGIVVVDREALEELSTEGE